jgi:rhodanese-related sulfurtransferase
VDLDGPPITLVSVGEAKGSLDTGEALFVDVRSGDDFRAGHISGAVSLTSPDLDAAMRALPPGSQIIAYGDAARPDSAVRAAQIFIELGYPTVIALEGGYQAWVNAGHPVTTPDI